jgi:hypothetical protein
LSTWKHSVAEARAPYEVLFNKPNEFHILYPEMGPEEILDVMESFDRIQPLSVKCGPVVYSCSCRHCYQNYVCIESAVLSLLYNTQLEVVARYLSVIDLLHHLSPNQRLISAGNRLKSGLHFLKLSETF